jgi:hypothetical protein
MERVLKHFRNFMTRFVLSQSDLGQDVTGHPFSNTGTQFDPTTGFGK